MNKVTAPRHPRKPRQPTCERCGVSTHDALYIGRTQVVELHNGGVVRDRHTWECWYCGHYIHQGVRR